MGVPIEFQHEWTGVTEIVVSIILVSVAAYYLLSKDNSSSSQPNDYADRLTTQSTSYQRHSLKTLDIIGQLNTVSQPTPPSPITDNHDMLHSYESSSGILQKMAASSQDIKESVVETGSKHLPDEMSTWNDLTDDSPTMAGSIGARSEAEKTDNTAVDLDVNTLYDSITTTTSSVTNSLTTVETIVQDLGSNQHLEISESIITSRKNTAHTPGSATTTPAHMEYQQKDENNGNKGGKRGIIRTVDQVETNDDGEDWITYQTATVESPRPSTSMDDDSRMMESTEYTNLGESSTSTHTNGNAKLKDVSGILVMGSYSKNKTNESATALDHKKAYRHGTPTKSTNSGPANEPTVPKKTKQRDKTYTAATDSSKASPVRTHQPKQDKARLERIDQQRQSYTALYKSRCEFWPKCTNNHCKYFHPFMECRNGNRCKFGKKCVFLHPQDYLDNYSKQKDQAKKKSKSKINATGDELHANQDKPSRKTVE